MLYSVIFTSLFVFHAAISAQEEDEADFAMESLDSIERIKRALIVTGLNPTTAI